jgi:hypothetical protein
MKNIMKSRPLVVGIFDDERNLNRAVERLAAEGFEDTVFDEATVSEGPANSGPTPVGPVLVAGAVPVQAVGKGDLSQAARSFRSRLADYDLPETEVETYAREFERSAKFILVTPDPERMTRAMEVLRECQASRINKHE